MTLLTACVLELIPKLVREAPVYFVVVLFTTVVLPIGLIVIELLFRQDPGLIATVGKWFVCRRSLNFGRNLTGGPSIVYRIEYFSDMLQPRRS
jgi:hypothetical protein